MRQAALRPNMRKLRMASHEASDQGAYHVIGSARDYRSSSGKAGEGNKPSKFKQGAGGVIKCAAECTDTGCVTDRKP